MVNISEILSSLAQYRPVFHSEADFQHTFAWEIHRWSPGASVRLKSPVPIENQCCSMDVRVAHSGAVPPDLYFRPAGTSI